MIVMTIVGTRPELIKLSRVIDKLDRYSRHVLVHTGQNFDFELNGIFFQEMGIRKPDFFLDAAKSNAAQTIAEVIARSDALMGEVKPDALLLLGDTNSCLSCISAKRRKIPIFHMEAGNRCFDQRVPEEVNRKIVDHTSDINMPYSSIAREYLLTEGFPADRVIKTGSPMFEILDHFRPQIDQSQVLETLGLRGREFFVVSAHREENIDSERNFPRLVELLNQLAERFGKPVVFSTHPRTRKKIEETGISFHRDIQLMKPLGFFDYVRLQENAFLVVSDSGTISEESSILNFHAINIREAHERPEAMEEGAVTMTGLNLQRILETIDILKDQSTGRNRSIPIVEDYRKPNVSDKVVRIIESYTDYVNRIVWKRQ